MHGGAVDGDVTKCYHCMCVLSGKLCLQDKSVAKKCVPAMARELEVSTSDAVRNNVIIILRDLCVRCVKSQNGVRVV